MTDPTGETPIASPPPRRALAADAMPWKEWSHESRFGGRMRHLTRAVLGEDAAYHVGVVMEELAPGRQSCPLHYHMHEEEHVFVLAGEMTLRRGDARETLKAGDYACFPAGERIGHCFENAGDAPCRYIMIGERKPDREVCVYPDSNKAAIDALGVVLDLGATKGYWDGE
jgi:uncharacterized cupin superfamily protein